MLDLRPFPNFDAAARAVLAFLHKRLGFDLWMVTRTEGDDWIVLHAEDHGYGVQEGAVFRWADTFCSQMVRGLGPRVAPNVAEVPAYAAAAIGRQIPIGSYIGVPMSRSDGALFGTLCAVDPSPQSQAAAIEHELPLVELLGRLLCGILESDLVAAEQTRRADRALAEALTDSLTGLYNRRGWDQLVTAEESRCQRYGHPACIVSIDLDGLKAVNDTYGHSRGDQLIRAAAEAIRSSIRVQDIAARIGGDEFSVLGVECNIDGAGVLETRLRQTLSDNEVQASVGIAIRDPKSTLVHTLELADTAMYANKKERRARR